MKLAVLERLDKFPYTYNRRNVVITQAPSFLNRALSFLQITKDNHKSLKDFECQPDSITFNRVKTS